MDTSLKNPFANRQKVMLATLCMVCTLFAWSCQSNMEGNGEELTSLEGTKWKLAGIVNTQTGKLEVLNSKNCADCYTLTFVTDTKAEVFVEDYPSSRQKMELDISLLGEYVINFEDIPHLEDYVPYKFVSSLYSPHTKSYSVTSNELKFINEIDNYYLLFKRLK